MAISMNNGGGFGSRRGGRGHASALAEINVTPFVDVVLVLLVIFMLTAHVMEFGIEVDVPETRNTKESSKELPVVTITKAGFHPEEVKVATRVAGAGVAGFAGNAIVGGVVGGVVDVASGATLEHCPNPVKVVLQPVRRPHQPMPPPPECVVPDSTTAGARGRRGWTWSLAGGWSGSWRDRHRRTVGGLGPRSTSSAKVEMPFALTRSMSSTTRP